MRVENIHYVRQSLSDLLTKPSPSGFRIRIIDETNDLPKRPLHSGSTRIEPLQRWPGHHGLDATHLATVASHAIGLQRVMSPLTGDSHRPIQDLTVHHEAASHSRPYNHAKNRRKSPSRAQGRLGKGEAVRIIGRDHLDGQGIGQISEERPPVQASRVAVLVKPGRRVAGSGGANPYFRGPRQLAARRQLFNQLPDSGDDVVVAKLLLGIQALTGSRNLGPRPKHYRLDFRPTQINAPKVARFHRIQPPDSSPHRQIRFVA